MSISVDMLHRRTKVFPPEGSQLPVIVEPFWDNEELFGRFAVNYIGSDRLDFGLALQANQGHLYFTPQGGFEDPQTHPYQTAVLLAPLHVAWMTQQRATHQSVVTIEKLDQSVAGLSAATVFCCFTGSLYGGRAYGLTAANDGADPQHRIGMNIARFQFGNVPNISVGQSPNQNPTWENIQPCGYIDYDTRIFLQAIDLGNAWQLIAFIVNHPDTTPWQYEFRGTIIDDQIGAGMPALGGWAFSSGSPIELRGGYVGGWGPNDTPATWLIP